MISDKALKFSLNMVYQRILEITKEYNDTLSKGREPIVSHVLSKTKGYIAIYFKTYAFFIFIYRKAYIISWHRRGEDNILYQDGVMTVKDVSEIMRTMNDMIFGGFSPRRGSIWYQYGDKKNKSSAP